MNKQLVRCTLSVLVTLAGIAHAADPAPAAAAPAGTPPATTTAPATDDKADAKDAKKDPKKAGSAAAAFAAAANSAAAKPAASTDQNSLVTNVVGTQEAPTVLNVVPWKDKEVKLEKRAPTTAILNQVLQPLDRDVLRREVQYFRSLQEQKTQ